MPSFEILHSSNQGRVGRIITDHGVVDTPNFIFCATKGSVRGLGPWDLSRLGVQIILSNTYHMMIYPGAEMVKSAKGVHGISGWNGPMFTDSGGYQVFALGHGSVSNELKGKRCTNPTVKQINEEGVVFQSYREGNIVHLTPEKSIQMQIDMGADLIVNFDECTPFHITYEQTRAAMERTNRWQDRGLEYFQKHSNGSQGLYAVVQGSIYPDLRTTSMQYCSERDYFGYGIGGSLGQNLSDMHKVLEVFQKYKKPERPVHLLGMGGFIKEIFEALPYGIDTFDCVHPTRVARHGLAMGRTKIDIRRHTTSQEPLDRDCPCMTCSHYSRAALHILYRAGELTALVALAEHNVATMVRLMSDIRIGLANDSLQDVRKYWCGG